MKSTIKIVRCDDDDVNINTETTDLFKYNRTLRNNVHKIYNINVLKLITVNLYA